MSFLLKALQGQLRTIYELFSTLREPGIELEGAIDIEGQPISVDDQPVVTAPTPDQLQQRPYRLRPRKAVDYTDE
jgi:hypothetical protein